MKNRYKFISGETILTEMNRQKEFTLLKKRVYNGKNVIK